MFDDKYTLFFEILQVSSDGNLLYHDWRLRHILVGAEETGLHFGDFIDDRHAVHDLAEDRVAVALGCWRREVQEVVVDEVYENWLVAESTTMVRAIAIVPRLFLSPFTASLRIGSRVGF